MHNYRSADFMLCWNYWREERVNAHEHQPEETGSSAWRAMPISWIATEEFAPRLLRGQVGVRLLIWTGNDTQWATPLLAGGNSGVSWTGSLNFTADGK
jgi:hypothetical protein